jgi:hypothetical protein
MNTKQELKSLVIEAKILHRGKKYKKAYMVLSNIFEEYNAKSYLDERTYIELLMLYRDLCYRYKRDVVARATEDEIIQTLIPHTKNKIDYLNIEITKSKNPDYTDGILNEIISTYTSRNVFAKALKKKNSGKKDLYNGSVAVVSEKKSTKALSLSNLFWWGVAFFVFAIYIFWQPIFVAYNDVFSSPEITKIAEQAGFNQYGKFIFYSNSPEVVGPDRLNEVCPNNSEKSVEFGCFDGNNKKIYILKSPDPEFDTIMYVTAAHEMLHAAWLRLSNTKREEVAGQLNLALSKNAGNGKLNTQISQYPKDKEIINSELHSFAGSEFTGIYDEYYKDYFNRIYLPYSNKVAYDSKVEAKIGAIDRKAAQLDALAAEINNFKNNYVYPFERSYYLDSYNYNAYKKNIDIVNQKINYYNQLLNEHNVEIEKAQKFFDSFLPTQKRTTKGSSI